MAKKMEKRENLMMQNRWFIQPAKQDREASQFHGVWNCLPRFDLGTTKMVSEGIYRADQKVTYTLYQNLPYGIIFIDKNL